MPESAQIAPRLGDMTRHGFRANSNSCVSDNFSGTDFGVIRLKSLCGGLSLDNWLSSSLCLRLPMPTLSPTQANLTEHMFILVSGWGPHTCTRKVFHSSRHDELPIKMRIFVWNLTGTDSGPLWSKCSVRPRPYVGEGFFGTLASTLQSASHPMTTRRDACFSCGPTTGPTPV